MQTYDHPTYGTLKLGRAPRTFGHVTPISAVRAMRAIPLPPLPAMLDQAKSPDVAHIFLNNSLGDCTCAGMANAIELVTAAAQGTQAPITDAQVLAAYEAFGYVPGNEASDQGAAEQDVLRWWQQIGFPLADGTLVRAGSVFEVNPSNIAGLCEVVMEFGFAYIGFEVPSGLMETLPPLWVDDPAFGPSESGHCVLLTGFDRTNPSMVTFKVTTWGTNEEFQMRQDFLVKYCDEAYAVFLPEWVEATGKTPYGFDAVGLAAIGGEVGTDLTAASARPDYGALEAAKLGVTRNPRWAEVEREIKAANPQCAGCGDREPAVGLQVHHNRVFHECVLVGRPDLEMDPRNLYCLCETEAARPARNCHLAKGHLDNFQTSNPDLAADLVIFFGMDQAACKADPRWQARAAARPAPFPQWTPEERAAFRAQLDAELPPDPAVLVRFGLTVN